MQHIRGLMSAIVFSFLFIAAHPALAEPSMTARQKENLNPVVQAANKASIDGPASIPLLDEGVLDLPKGYSFIPQKEAAALLEAVGHHTGEGFMGIIGVADSEPDAKEQDWMIAVTFVKSGYVKDDDAKNWKADELLKNIQEATLAENKNRSEKGFPALTVSGWVEPPAYDAVTHRLVWSALVQRLDAPNPDPSVNYNTYALGRDGFFTLDLVSPNSTIARDKPRAAEILSALHYNSGKQYQDFAEGTDRVAEFGLAALIAGVAAKKLGLLAIAGVFLVKIAKVAILSCLVFMKKIKGFFRRGKKPDNEPDKTA